MASRICGLDSAGGLVGCVDFSSAQWASHCLTTDALSQCPVTCRGYCAEPHVVLPVRAPHNMDYPRTTWP